MLSRLMIAISLGSALSSFARASTAKGLEAASIMPNILSVFQSKYLGYEYSTKRHISIALKSTHGHASVSAWPKGCGKSGNPCQSSSRISDASAKSCSLIRTCQHNVTERWIW